MALGHSPKIVTDGLVFAYDMANTQKSWKGRPVTNQFAVPVPDSNNNVGFQVNGTGTFKRVLSGRYAGYDIKSTDIVYRYDLGANGCHYHGNDVTINAGQTATFSCDYYIDPSTTGYPSINYLANFEGVVSGSASDPTPSQIGVWKRFVFSSTAGSTGTCRMLLYPGACGGGNLAPNGFILYKNPQVEFDAPGNTPSPFVNGTRTNTQSLIDLTNNNTITANSLTYNADGTFGFNGTNSYLNAGINIPNTSAFSLECFVNPANTQVQYSGIMGNHGSGGTTGIYCQQQSTSLNNYHWGYGNGSSWGTACAFSLTSNAWHHLVLVKDANYNYAYVNGVLVNTTATNGTAALGGFNICFGRDYESSRYFNGSISNGKIYNRALTAAEVKQNFSALRGRYGI